MYCKANKELIFVDILIKLTKNDSTKGRYRIRVTVYLDDLNSKMVVTIQKKITRNSKVNINFQAPKCKYLKNIL